MDSVLFFYIFNIVYYVLIFGILSYLVLVWPYLYWSNRGVPQYNVWKIWKNHVVEFFTLKSLIKSIEELYKDFSDKRYFGVYQLFTPKLCINNPDLIQRIFVKDFEYFTDRIDFIPVNCDSAWKRNLSCLKGSDWHNTRLIADSCFTSDKMKYIFEIMLEYSQQLLSHLEEQNSDLLIFEVKDLFKRITNDMFASTHFGALNDSLRNPNNTLLSMSAKRNNFGTFLTKVKFILLWFLPNTFKIRLFNRVTEYFRQLVTESIKHRKLNGIARPDFIEILMNFDKYTPMNHKNETIEMGLGKINNSILKVSQLTEEDISRLTTTFFDEGFDNTFNLASFTAQKLASNLRVQENLQKEIDLNLKSSNESISYEALTKMKYLDMVVSEALRLCPEYSFIDRICVKPYTIQPIYEGEVPIHLKQGDAVWVSLHCLHRDARYFPDPECFYPERFSDENKLGIHSYAFMPFGSGPRCCIGKRFALLVESFQSASHDFWLGLKRRLNLEK